MQLNPAFPCSGNRSSQTIVLWLRKVEDMNRTEDLILTATDRHETYKKTWNLWNLFIHSEEGKSLFRT